MDIIEHAKIVLSFIFNTSRVDDGHGIDHSNRVLKHAENALYYEPNLNSQAKLAIRLAALLHDADDNKFFPNRGNQNTHYVLEQVQCSQETAKLVIRMISLVSCSKNRNEHVEPGWLLIPRFADRLEAMGAMGVIRCYLYSLHSKRPLSLDTTPKACTLLELERIVLNERFAKYSGTSQSMMDHFYDKLLHLSKMDTKNLYIQKEAITRHKVLTEFCLEFGRTGKVNKEQIHTWMCLITPNLCKIHGINITKYLEKIDNLPETESVIKPFNRKLNVFDILTNSRQKSTSRVAFQK